MNGTLPRRAFLGQLAIGTAGLAAAQRVAAAPAVAAPTAPGTRPAGDLARRIDLTARRLTQSGIPAYTEDFVLADVTLDTRRRFWNFSGDLSGRWVEALAVLPPAGRSPADLAPLVAKLLAQQKPDGRFGRTDLAFTAAETGNEHMALLWGNGRLLVGLMAYWQASRDAAVLAAARRLAGFLLAVREATKAPEVMARVEGQGAFGFICFTQLAEGLAMLTQATGDGSYAAAAREIVPLLQPRGVQHSHGYLSTLRGAALLHEARRATPRCSPSRSASTASSWDRATTRSTAGSWSTSAGATPRTRRRSPPRRPPRASFPRNEGCGLADFVRLSLQLHRATGRVEYLERAERCLVNGFAHNQFANGDFGSRVFFDQGIQPSPSVDRAWWCCTMHGYRAFRDVLDHAVVERDGTVAVQLFEDVDFRGRKAGLQRATYAPRAHRARSRAGSRAPWPYASRPGPTAPRSRGTGSLTRPRRDGRLPATRGPLRRGRPDRGAACPAPAPRHPKGEEIPLGRPGHPSPCGAALYCGPWLVVADEQIDPVFFGEPWPGNVVTLPRDLAPRATAEGRVRLARGIRARRLPRVAAHGAAGHGRDAGRRAEDDRLLAQLPPSVGHPRRMTDSSSSARERDYVGRRAYRLTAEPSSPKAVPVGAIVVTWLR